MPPSPSQTKGVVWRQVSFLTYTSELILTSVSGIEASSDDPRTELECHDNVFILGSNLFVFESTGRNCNVQPFSSELSMAKCFIIVDGALACDCTCTGEVYVLVDRNKLYTPSIDYSLISTFIMRARGVVINNVPKIHYEDHIVDDHNMSFDRCNLRILLRLNGVFSCFHMIVPTNIELHECKKLLLTSCSSDCNPQCQSYERNDQSMFDLEGNIRKHYRR